MLPAAVRSKRVTSAPSSLSRDERRFFEANETVPITVHVADAVPALADAQGGEMVLLQVAEKPTPLQTTWAALVCVVDCNGMIVLRGRAFAGRSSR